MFNRAGLLAARYAPRDAAVAFVYVYSYAVSDINWLGTPTINVILGPPLGPCTNDGIAIRNLVAHNSQNISYLQRLWYFGTVRPGDGTPLAHSSGVLWH
jgi:hypothetical protein